jgi:uncharacterized protein YjbI with pentapeptide repeats
MANEKQLAILKQGVRVWNKWRSDHRNAKIDLRRADLTGEDLIDADLSKADLRYANLSQANLSQAFLPDAYLNHANFMGANLTFAILSESDLRNANLRNANCDGADLEGAMFGEANLRKAILTQANLTGADLVGANLSGANLRGANLEDADCSYAHFTKANLVDAQLDHVEFDHADLAQADLSGAELVGAFLSDANLTKAHLTKANLHFALLMDANLREADLREADLTYANLRGADCSYADFTGADLTGAVLADAIVEQAKVTGSTVYAISVWNLQGKFRDQKDLIITDFEQPIIRVDNIEIAQFVYLILHNEKIRDVINTLTSKSVLILGRFALPERKAVLDALRNRLREYDLLPIVFDFVRPTHKDFTETIKTLAGLSYFVIADITNPKSSPLELQATVPDYQVPFVPIIQKGERPFAMMVDLQKKYSWVLDTLTYSSIDTLIKALKPAIIDPAIKKHNELRLIKAREPKILAVEDFIDDKGLDNHSKSSE